MKFCESSKIGNHIIKRPSCNGKNRKKKLQIQKTCQFLQVTKSYKIKQEGNKILKQ